jgi:hypothetical protein
MNTWRWLIVVCLWAVALPTWAATAKKKPKTPPKPQIAVIAFEGLAPATARGAAENELRALLPTTDYAIQPAATTAATLDAVKKLGLACDSGDVDCLIRVGALTGAAVVIKGILSSDGDGFVLDLVAADVGGLRERGRVRVNVPASGDERRAALESAVVGVLRPEAWRGQLRVAVSQRGASIVVDGVPRGFAPLSAPIELAPGNHAIFVGLEGFAAWKGTVDVRYADVVDVDVALVPGVAEEAPTFTTKPAQAPPTPLAAMPPARRGPMRVIVYDVEARGVEPRIAALVGTFLVAELRKREQVSVLDTAELRALVGDGTSTSGDARGCREDQCFAEIAEALGADAVVVTSLTGIEGQTLFGLRRIDPARQEVAGSFVGRAPAQDSTALLPFIGEGIAATFGDIALRHGQKAGVDDSARFVLEPPPVPALVTQGLGLAALVGGGAGLALGGSAAVVWLDYRAALDARTDNATLREREAVYGALQVGSIVGLSTGVLFGLATGAAAPFTDWQGYGNAAGLP